VPPYCAETELEASGAQSACLSRIWKCLTLEDCLGRHATGRKVADSSLDEVIDFF
jgi:hypothetical protein